MVDGLQAASDQMRPMLAAAGMVTVFGLNRSLSETISVEVSVSGPVPPSASATLLTGPSYDAGNDDPDALTMVSRTRDLTVGGHTTADLPPCLLTVIRLGPQARTASGQGLVCVGCRIDKLCSSQGSRALPAATAGAVGPHAPATHRPSQGGSAVTPVPA